MDNSSRGAEVLIGTKGASFATGFSYGTGLAGSTPIGNVSSKVGPIEPGMDQCSSLFCTPVTRLVMVQFPDVDSLTCWGDNLGS